jgi:spore germination protein GerM
MDHPRRGGRCPPAGAHSAPLHWIVAAAAILLLLAGCGRSAPEAGTPVTVYALGEPDDRAALVGHIRICPEDRTLWKFALEEVIAGAGGRSPFPPGVTVTKAELEEGVVSIVLSGEAAPLTGIALTLARACVVLTLTGLDGIDGAALRIEGQPPEPVFLRASDFVLGSLVLPETERAITLFFADETGEQAVTETHTLVVRETDTLDFYLHYMLEQLIEGPRTPEFKPVLPEGTRLISVSVEGSVCTVNFSAEFVTGAEGSAVSPDMILHCLVRSVTAQPGVSSLRLLADGRPLEKYGTADTSQPLTAGDVRR